MQKNPLFEFDPKIERTFYKLKRQRVLLTKSSLAGGEETQRWTPRDYITSSAHSQTPGITITPVATNNFELEPVLISMVQHSSSAVHQ